MPLKKGNLSEENDDVDLMHMYVQICQFENNVHKSLETFGERLVGMSGGLIDSFELSSDKEYIILIICDCIRINIRVSKDGNDIGRIGLFSLYDKNNTYPNIYRELVYYTKSIISITYYNWTTYYGKCYDNDLIKLKEKIDSFGILYNKSAGKIE